MRRNPATLIPFVLLLAATVSAAASDLVAAARAQIGVTVIYDPSRAGLTGGLSRKLADYRRSSLAAYFRGRRAYVEWLETRTDARVEKKS